MISFSVTRACLRLILAHVCECSPTALHVVLGKSGKPLVENGPSFNVSHSGAYSVIALSRDRPVGVDVERMRPRPVDNGLSAYFSDPEALVIRERSGREGVLAFYSCWTRKEAYLKARGEGLPFGLDRFTVSIAPSPPSVIWVRDEPEEPNRWRLCDLSIDTDYAGAVAAEGHDWELVPWSLDVQNALTGPINQR